MWRGGTRWDVLYRPLAATAACRDVALLQIRAPASLGIRESRSTSERAIVEMHRGV